MLPIIGDIIGPIINKVLDYIPDAKTKAEAALKLQQELDANSEKILTALSAIDTAQIAVNTEEAKSPNLFVAGWRPSIGWICSAAFAYAYVLQPMLMFGFTAAGHPLKDLPAINISEMMPVLLGILGLGGMRSWEKSKGVHNEH